MVRAEQQAWSLAEFLEWEATQDDRFELVGGVIRMMTGGTIAHATIKGNVFAVLHAALRGKPCRVFVDGPKVATTDAAVYPDVVVSCTPSVDTSQIVPNPVIIFEVLSKGTEGVDRGDKWQAYQEISSLRQYVLIAQHRASVESFTRSESGWKYEKLERLDADLRLDLGELALSVHDIYLDTSILR